MSKYFLSAMLILAASTASSLLPSERSKLFNSWATTLTLNGALEQSCIEKEIATTLATIKAKDSSYIQSAADSLKSLVSWTASKTMEITGDASEILTEPVKNLMSSMGDFAAKHPWFTMMAVGATSYYLYSSWKSSIQQQEEKRKNAGDLIEMCIAQSKNSKDTSKSLNKTSAACLKTAAHDIIGYYDWKVINPLSWSEAAVFYNNRFRVVYTAKELVKEIENNVSESTIITTAQNLLTNFKQLPA